MRTRLHGFLLQRVRRRVRVNLRRDAEFGGTPVIPLTKIHNSAVNSMRYGIKRVSRCTVRWPITVSEWTTNDCVTSHVPPFICRKTRLVNPARNVRRILVRGSMPACRLRRRKLWKFDYEVVHSEVYLNNYVVSIAPFSTSACPDALKI